MPRIPIRNLIRCRPRSCIYWLKFEKFLGVALILSRGFAHHLTRIVKCAAMSDKTDCCVSLAFTKVPKVTRKPRRNKTAL